MLPRQRSATKTAPDMTKNKTADRCRYCYAECSLPPPPLPSVLLLLHSERRKNNLPLRLCLEHLWKNKKQTSHCHCSLSQTSRCHWNLGTAVTVSKRVDSLAMLLRLDGGGPVSKKFDFQSLCLCWDFCIWTFFMPVFWVVLFFVRVKNLLRVSTENQTKEEVAAP